MTVPDVGLSTEALQARYQREQAGLGRIQTLAPALGTLPDLHHWLYSHHQAYATVLAGCSNPLAQPAKTIASPLLPLTIDALNTY